jgi:hypothetical protein
LASSVRKYNWLTLSNIIIIKLMLSFPHCYQIWSGKKWLHKAAPNVFAIVSKTWKKYKVGYCCHWLCYHFVDVIKLTQSDIEVTNNHQLSVFNDKKVFSVSKSFTYCYNSVMFFVSVSKGLDYVASVEENIETRWHLK